MTKARKLADLIDANGDVSVGNLDNVTANAITAGTLDSARLPVVPVAKGGTGASTLGTAGQYLKVNATADGVEYGNVSVPSTLSSFTNDVPFFKDVTFSFSSTTEGTGNCNNCGDFQCQNGGTIILTDSGTELTKSTSNCNYRTNCNCNCN